MGTDEGEGGSWGLSEGARPPGLYIVQTALGNGVLDPFAAASGGRFSSLGRGQMGNKPFSIEEAMSLVEPLT